MICDLGIAQQNFVEALANSVNEKSEYKTNHAQNVATLSKEICKQLELNEKTTDLIYYAGLLQNIGKIILPQTIFSKSGKLTKEEWQKLNDHTNFGVNLLMNINFLSEIIPYIHYNRERYDGVDSQYGLKGNSIPLGSRIIAVADAYCALTSDRPHREKLSNEEALEIIKSEASSKWDPIIVDTLFNRTLVLHKRKSHTSPETCLNKLKLMQRIILLSTVLFITINPNRPSNDLWSFCYIHWGAIKMISNR